MDKKAPNLQDAINEMNKELLESKPYHEVESIILDNQNKRIELIKKEKEIGILENKLKDYKLTRAIAWFGGISAIVRLLLELIQYLMK